MREIKFRAWNTEKNDMITCSGYWWEEEFTGQEDLADTPGFVVMQYTGLKDKNGKEIYEEDVLSKSGHRNRIVKYVIDAFIAEPIPFTEKDGPYRLKNYTHGCEVIGNIYENPELLTNPK